MHQSTARKLQANVNLMSEDVSKVANNIRVRNI